MDLKGFLLCTTIVFGVAFAAACTQLQLNAAELPTVVEKVVTQIEVKTVEVPVEVPVEVIKYVPQVETVTEVEYVEVPVEVNTTTEVPVYLNELPACLYDEVTEVNCFWNAQTQGNGEGESFIAYNGNAYYVR